MNKYLKDASILSIGILISRILGLIFVFPFSKIVGEEGVTLYSYAYVPYTLFLDISTLGIPIGISKLVSKYNSKNDTKNRDLVFKNAIIFMTIIGIILFILLNILAKKYASIIIGGNTNSIDLKNTIIVIRLISLSIPIIPLVSVLRGYMQGNLMYLPTSISQIFEQLFKVSISLIGSYILVYKFNLSYEYGVFISVFSTFIGSVVALIIVLIFYFKKYKFNFKEKLKLDKKVIKELLVISIPFGIFGITFGLFQFIDSLFFNTILINKGITNSKMYYGIINFNIQKLIFIPISILLTLSQSILPRITESYNLKENRKIIKYINDSIEKIILISIPITLLIILFKFQIYDIFYKENNFGGKGLLIYSLMIGIYSLNGLLVNSLLGINKNKTVIISLIVSISIKLITTPIFLNIFLYYGSIISTILSLSIGLLINIIILNKNKYINLFITLKKVLLILIINLIIFLLIYSIKKILFINNIYIYVSLFSLIYFILYYIALKLSQIFKKQIN